MATILYEPKIRTKACPILCCDQVWEVRMYFLGQWEALKSELNRMVAMLTDRRVLFNYLKYLLITYAVPGTF